MFSYVCCICLRASVRQIERHVGICQFSRSVHLSGDASRRIHHKERRRRRQDGVRRLRWQLRIPRRGCFRVIVLHHLYILSVLLAIERRRELRQIDRGNVLVWHAWRYWIWVLLKRIGMLLDNTNSIQIQIYPGFVAPIVPL